MSNLIDARQLKDQQLLNADVCIVGAGAAGITLARSFANQKFEVLLIESGGFELEGQTQSLYAGKNLGLLYHPLSACRLRFFGGTTNHWSGYCRSNDEIDYEGRPELGLPKWPVGHNELSPFIEQVGKELNIDSGENDARAVISQKGWDSDALLYDKDIETKSFQLVQNRRLGPRYKTELTKQSNLRIVHHLNLKEVSLEELGESVEKLNCKTLNEKEIFVKAKKYIIACHGIENARILLASNSVQKSGIGNEYDHVGRYFMDHIHIHASRFYPSKKFPQIYDWAQAYRDHLNINLSFTDDFQRANKLLSYYCRFRPAVYSDTETDSEFHFLMSNYSRKGDLEFLKTFFSAMKSPLSGLKYLSSKRHLKYFLPLYFNLDHRIEQAPNRNSRVVLSDRLDEIGNRIADLDWQINEYDVDSFKRGQDYIVKKLSALGWGRFQLEDIDSVMVKNKVAGHYHQIGTTRMSEDPKNGVVDNNCKVHGVDNLYIAGSSVFPTAGYSGPTMILMALALRLSEHLKAEL
jgi:choline dehydrogenase-like flavoprotein